MALTSSLIDPSLSVNHVVRRHPETIRLLTQRGIDTCCDGGLSLSAAAADAGIDVIVLLQQLAVVVGTEGNGMPR